MATVTCKLKSPNGNEITIEGDPNDKTFQDLCKAKDENRQVYLSGYTYPWNVSYYSMPYRWYNYSPYYTYQYPSYNYPFRYRRY